jgi:hypothetical protein
MSDKFILMKSGAGLEEIDIIKAFVNIWIDGQVTNPE